MGAVFSSNQIDIRDIREIKPGEMVDILSSNRIDISEIKPGDHIYSWMDPITFSAHHGIYVGDDLVIHFTPCKGKKKKKSSEGQSCSDRRCQSGRSGVVQTCLNCFVSNGIFRYKYGVSKLHKGIRRRTSTHLSSDSPETVIRRARYHLENGFGEYDLLTNNCEHFALYCETGKHEPRNSGQIDFWLGQ